ncbi:MAG: cell division protein ZapA [Lactobacillus sp.]|jgi:cell division protein ZapA|nr:cell division protein ZapA [Lactobacillus sp.]
MAQVTISVNNREYAVATEDGQEARILQLANLMDDKAKMFAGSEGQISENMILVMIGLLLADELTESKKGKSSKKDDGASVDKNRILEIDKLLSSLIKSTSDELKDIANKIDLL